MAVKRLQRGASLELRLRELKVTTAGLKDWRDRVEGAAETELKDQTHAPATTSFPTAGAKSAR